MDAAGRIETMGWARPAAPAGSTRRLGAAPAGGAASAALPVEASGSESPGWWGMVAFLATEATLFACLVSSYFYLRSLSPRWPPEGIALPELRLPLIGTAVLVGSSLPMHWADCGIRQGDQWRLRLGLALSFALGAIFIGIQAVEYSRKDFQLQSNVYGSLFFTITGFHGLHVLGGLLINLYTQLRAWLGHFNERRHLAVQNAALYWHFVDAVWVVLILPTIYLSPYWL